MQNITCDQLYFQSCCCTQFKQAANAIFTITAEINACSLANFYCQYADRHMNLKFMLRVSEREPAIQQFVVVKKQTDVSFLCICPAIDHEFCHHIVKAIAEWIHRLL